MIAGAVLDPSLIRAFASGDAAALLAVDRFDMAAQALLVPMTAMAEALSCLTTLDEVERALVLLELSVAIDDELDRRNVQSVPTARLTAKAPTTLGAAHAAVAARGRAWKVLTGDADHWAAAFPDIEAVGSA